MVPWATQYSGQAHLQCRQTLVSVTSFKCCWSRCTKLASRDKQPPRLQHGLSLHQPSEHHPMLHSPCIQGICPVSQASNNANIQTQVRQRPLGVLHPAVCRYGIPDVREAEGRRGGQVVAAILQLQYGAALIHVTALVPDWVHTTDIRKHATSHCVGCTATAVLAIPIIPVGL